jgi:hypothetical protein
MKCMLSFPHLRFYPRLISTSSIGDFYRGCGVCLLVAIRMFLDVQQSRIFYSTFMVATILEKPWTVVLFIAKLAAAISISHQIAHVKWSVNDLMSSSCYLNSILILTRKLSRTERSRICFRSHFPNVFA